MCFKYKILIKENHIIPFPTENAKNMKKITRNGIM